MAFGVGLPGPTPGFESNGLSRATAIDFANNAEGWALVNQSGCRSFKSDCWSVTYIEQTDDDTSHAALTPRSS